MRNKTAIFLVSIMLLSGLAVIQVNAGNDLPSNAELHLGLTSFTPYDSTFKMKDPLIVDGVIDLSFITGFKLLKEKTVLDLSASTFESDSDMLFDRPEYSLTLINSTWNAGTTNGAGNVVTTTELTASYGETQADALLHTNDTTATWKEWASGIVYDSNEDGDYSDAGDKSYLPHGQGAYYLVGFKVSWNVTDVDDFAEVILSFETTGSSDYNVSLRHYQTSGDTGWADLTSSSDGAGSFYAYDTNNTFIMHLIPLEELISEDLGDSPVIRGLDRTILKSYQTGVNQTATMQITQIGIFKNFPALTDKTDDDDDLDWNDAENIWANPWDDNDLIVTSITEGGTESYDNAMPLLATHMESMVLLKDARLLTFTNVAAIDPAFMEATSSLVSGTTYYLTTEVLNFDTRGVDDLDAFSNIMTLSEVQLNVTVDDAVVQYTTDYEDNLVAFTVDSINKFNTFKSAWEASSVTDDIEIQFNIVDFSTTSGDLQDIVLSYYTSKTYSVIGGAGAAAPSAGIGMDVILIGLAAFMVLSIVGYVYILKPSGKKSSRSKGRGKGK